jgi:hypothetical protein
LLSFWIGERANTISAKPFNLSKEINMDTISQAFSSFNAALGASSSVINTVAAASLGVEQMAAQAVATGAQAMTGPQKLQAALSLASALDPQINAVALPLESIFSAVVGIWHLFGVFPKHTNA